MQELTQEKLDDYNTLYCWDYNDMCDFIENHSEEEFVDHFETYNRLVDVYGQLVVDEFIEEFDTDAIEHFEDMFQGQYTSGAEFAEMIASDCGYVSRDMPSWIEIDCDMSDYTYGHIFSNNY